MAQPKQAVPSQMVMLTKLTTTPKMASTRTTQIERNFCTSLPNHS